MTRVVRAARAAALATALALVLAGAAAGRPAARAAATGASWQAAPSPFRLTFLADGKPVAAEATTSGGPGGHLSYRLADGSFHGLRALLGSRAVAGGTEYRVATDEPARTAFVSVRTAGGGLAVSLRLEPASGVVQTYEAFAATAGEHFLGGGERPAPLDLAGQTLAVKTSYACQNTMPAPFFLSSAGYGATLLGTAIASLGFPGATGAACNGGAEPKCPVAGGLDVVQLCAKSATLAYRLFLGSPASVVSAYATAVGRPRVPPPTLFELIKWRDIVSGPSQLYADVSILRRLGIPLGWILLDNPWEENGCYGTMRFDPRFGDPATLLRTLHERRVLVMLWVSPLVRRQWCAPPAQYGASSLLSDPNLNASTLDLTDPATLRTFESSLQALVALGVDGFKADRGDELDLEPLRLAGGDGVTLNDAYPLLYARAVDAAVRAAGHEQTFAELFRAGAPGSAAVATGFWGGDQPGTFDGLVQAIHDGLSAGVAGFPIWGSDTGGYGNVEPPLTPEVFVRWAQFSAVCPVFEVGGVGQSATFWSFGTPTVSLFRDAAILHYELFPYLYGLALAAHSTGLPILRPLALAYPGDPNAWRFDLEALVGPSLLAAPVTAPAPNGTVAQPQVYLPAGSWIDLATGRTVAGGGAPFVRPTPLAQLPLYLRAGAAIPFAARTPLLWRGAWPTDALTMRDRGGWLYAPAPGRTSVSDRSFGRLAAVATGSTVSLSLSGAPPQTQVLVAGRPWARSVSLDGAPLPRARSLAALRAAAEGWLPVQAPFPGVVLKLAPAGGAAQVRLVLR